MTEIFDQATRTYLLEHLDQSTSNLYNCLANVSPAQFTFKPAPERWSISECLEHILKTEKGVFNFILQLSQNLPHQAPLTLHPKEKLVHILESRKQAVRSPEPFVPTGHYDDKSKAIEIFENQRVTVINFINTTDLPLEKIAFPHPILGVMNSIGWLAFLSAHCNRHVQQMEEVKKFDHYPK